MTSSNTKGDINGFYIYIYMCVCVHICVCLYISHEQLVTGGKVTGAEQVTAHQLSYVKSPYVQT